MNAPRDNPALDDCHLLESLFTAICCVESGSSPAHNVRPFVIADLLAIAQSLTQRAHQQARAALDDSLGL